MKTFYAQQGEDVFIWQNFINLRCPDGIFVEIGAYDGLTYSNTKFFEDEFSMQGVLIEPSARFAQLKQNRPNCDCYQLAVGYEAGKIRFLGHDATAGAIATMTESFRKAWHTNSVEYEMDSLPFGQILEKSHVKYIDLLSIDVEGGELMVLKTMNWEIPVYIVVIELDGYNQEKDEQCRNILRERGFVFSKRININEFWWNPHYHRKHLLYQASNTVPTSFDEMRFLYLEPHVRPEIEKALK